METSTASTAAPPPKTEAFMLRAPSESSRVSSSCHLIGPGPASFLPALTVSPPRPTSLTARLLAQSLDRAQTHRLTPQVCLAPEMRVS